MSKDILKTDQEKAKERGNYEQCGERKVEINYTD